MIRYIRATNDTFAARGEILTVVEWMTPGFPVVLIKGDAVLHLAPREWRYLSALELLAEQAE